MPETPDLHSAAQALADSVVRRLDDLRSIENSRHGLSGDGLHLLNHIKDFEPAAQAVRAALAAEATEPTGAEQ